MRVSFARSPLRSLLRPSIRAAAGVLLLAPLAGGCWPFATSSGGGRTTAPAQGPALRDQVADARAQAEAKPGDAAAAMQYAGVAEVALRGGVVAPGSAEARSLVDDVAAKIDAAAQASPEQVAGLQAAVGNVMVAAGDTTRARARYEASMQAEPNLVALGGLAPIYAQAGELDVADQACVATRSTVEGDAERRFVLLDICAGLRPGAAPREALPWASAEDVGYYEGQLQARQAEAARRAEEDRARREEEARARQAREEEARRAQASRPAASPAPAVYQATVRVYNACPEKVRLFRGRTNGKYPGSGTYGWHSENTTSSYHLSGNDELCIVENDRLILSCIKPPSGANVQITESCSGFRNR